MNCVDLLIAASALSFGWSAGKMLWEVICSRREDYSFPRSIYYYIFKACAFVFICVCFITTRIPL